MKFDVVVGNPPYNPPTRERTGGSGTGTIIWHKFLSLALESLLQDGYLVFIIPTQWRHGDYNDRRWHKKAQVALFSYEIIDWQDVKKYFPTIGRSIGIDALVAKKTNATNMTISYRNCIFPRTNDATSKEILDDWLNAQNSTNVFSRDIKLNHQQRYKDKYRKTSYHDKLSGYYPHLNTGAQTNKGLYDWYPCKTNGFDTPKIIVHDSAPVNPFVDLNGEFGCGTHSSGYTIKSKEDAQDIVEFFDSKLFSWIISQFNEPGSFSIPVQLFDRIPKSWRILEEKYFS
jgi:hypothetical protein